MAVTGSDGCEASAGVTERGLGSGAVPHTGRGLVPHTGTGLVPLIASAAGSCSACSVASDLWLPSGFYSVSQVLSHGSQGWSRTEAASFFSVGGVSQRQVVGARPRPCHLPNRVVTELVTRDCPRTRGERGVFVPNNLLHMRLFLG